MRYTARATTSGRAHALAFTKDLAREHPEFTKGRFDVHVIAPGRLLVSAIDDVEEEEGDDSDPVLEAFLGFLEGQMAARPDLIRPFTAADVEGLDELLKDVEVGLDDDLGDFTLP
ncbi:MAG TPA: type II toxin-antitoxin system PrlF family antitoxin [Longimicrobium sp.]|jgi:hypothetical protein